MKLPRKNISLHGLRAYSDRILTIKEYKTIMALSSITKKLIMSISGLFLIIFMLLHTTINSFAVVDLFKGNWGSADGWYANGCAFMGWPIIDVMVPVLALGFIVHIVYALILTYGNMKARGPQRYAVAHQGKSESWASKNMLVLGVVVLGVIFFHMSHFWAEMQYAEWFEGKEFTELEHAHVYGLLETTFSQWWMVAIYIVWFAALWFHLTHGFWSALQTIGWSNKVWEKRLMCAGKAIATLIFVCLTIVAIVSYLVANKHIKIEPKAHVECCQEAPDMCGDCNTDYDFED
jgi:succinate dehydrogenase / fumarate reductase cytochrome b subunit